MAVDSGSYDDATLQRRYAMAQALMQHPQPIKHWAEGLGNLAESALGGYQLSKLDDERRAEKAAGRAELFTALGLPAPAVAPQASQGGFQKIAALLSGGGGDSPAPAAAPPVAPPAPMPAAAPPPSTPPVRMASLGPPSMPAAPARTPVEPMGDVIRTNPDGSIAGNITAPTIPAPATAKVAAALSPQANLTTAAPAGGLLAGVPVETRAQIAQLLSSRNPTANALGSAILQQSVKPHDVTYQTTPDGMILKMDPTGKTAPTPVYQAATKPTFGVIGEEDGKKTYGFIDPVKGTATPLEPAKPGDQRPTVTGPDGKEIVIPKGVDVPTFRKEIAKINADAAGGKKTEVQANSESFANRMEGAEKNFKGLETQASGMSGVAQTVAGKVPVVGAFGQSKDFQKMEQAKSQFITALLRRESGAAINKDEFTRYDKEFFPQPGNPPEVIKQKAEARRVAIEAMKKGAGPGYKSPTEAPADEGWQDLGGGVRIREKK